MSAEAQLTPMMAQYRRIKGELPKDALLLFRLGDFYEMFFEDAQAGAQLCNLSLTKRNGVPMCGLPHHAANGYIARILKAGRKVAICDQMEDAKPGKLVAREVTQILSPGTHFDERMLTAERNNYLASILASGKTFGLALVDLTTGDFKVTQIEGETELLTELDRLRPAEIIFPGEAASLHALLSSGQPEARLAASLPTSQNQRAAVRPGGSSNRSVSSGETHGSTPGCPAGSGLRLVAAGRPWILSQRERVRVREKALNDCPRSSGTGVSPVCFWGSCQANELTGETPVPLPARKS